MSRYFSFAILAVVVAAALATRASGQHTSGQLLLARQYPRYLRALMERRIIAAEDARSHELTR